LLQSDKLRNFFFNLKLSSPPQSDVVVMNPYVHRDVKEVCFKFFTKYFSDNNNRILVLGINPGRFGAGITGITFTDPIRLDNECGIRNDFIIQTLRQQISIAGYSDKVICLGEGKNYEYLNNLNKTLQLFREIIPLPHPRWIMQYHYKERMDYVREYVRLLKALI